MTDYVITKTKGKEYGPTSYCPGRGGDKKEKGETHLGVKIKKKTTPGLKSEILSHIGGRVKDEKREGCKRRTVGKGKNVW